MQLNGAIDRELYGIDFKTQILGEKAIEIDIKGCAAFSITNKGNVPLLLDGNIAIDAGNCNSRSFPNYLMLDYAINKPIEWLDTDVVNPNYKIELVKVFIVKKEVKTEVTNE